MKSRKFKQFITLALFLVIIFSLITGTALADPTLSDDNDFITTEFIIKENIPPENEYISEEFIVEENLP